MWFLFPGRYSAFKDLSLWCCMNLFNKRHRRHRQSEHEASKPNYRSSTDVSPGGEQHKRVFSDVVRESAAKIIKKVPLRDENGRNYWAVIYEATGWWSKQTDQRLRDSRLSLFFEYLLPSWSRLWKKRVHRSSENNKNRDIIIPGLALRPWLWEMEEGDRRGMRVRERVVKDEEIKPRQKHFQKTWVTWKHKHKQSAKERKCQEALTVKKGKLW